MMTRRRGLTLILLGIGVAIVGALGIALSGLYRDGTGSDPSAAVLAVWLVPLVGFVVSMLGVLILIQGPPERPVPQEVSKPTVFRAKPVATDDSKTHDSTTEH